MLWFQGNMQFNSHSLVASAGQVIIPSQLTLKFSTFQDHSNSSFSIPMPWCVPLWHTYITLGRMGEDQLRRYDGSIKKNTAFAKKLVGYKIYWINININNYFPFCRENSLKLKEKRWQKILNLWIYRTISWKL